ncbi:unnamed protein product, partial [Symbiodinium sp. CCMP2592]
KASSGKSGDLRNHSAYFTMNINEKSIAAMHPRHDDEEYMVFKAAKSRRIENTFSHIPVKERKKMAVLKTEDDVHSDDLPGGSSYQSIVSDLRPEENYTLETEARRKRTKYLREQGYDTPDSGVLAFDDDHTYDPSDYEPATGAPKDLYSYSPPDRPPPRVRSTPGAKPLVGHGTVLDPPGEGGPRSRAPPKPRPQVRPEWAAYVANTAARAAEAAPPATTRQPQAPPLKTSKIPPAAPAVSRPAAPAPAAPPIQPISKAKTKAAKQEQLHSGLPTPTHSQATTAVKFSSAASSSSQDPPRGPTERELLMKQLEIEMERKKLEADYLAMQLSQVQEHDAGLQGEGIN